VSTRRLKEQQKKEEDDDALIAALDMPEFLGHLMRNRSLYGVLDALAQALDARADAYRARLDRENQPVHWGVRTMYEEEVEFCQAVAQEVTALRKSLALKWQGHSPSFADGSFSLYPNQRMKEAGAKYFRGLLATLKDPSVSAEDTLRAGAELAREGRDTVWIDRNTGKPDFEIPKTFAQIAATIQEDYTQEDEKLQLAASVVGLWERLVGDGDSCNS